MDVVKMISEEYWRKYDLLGGMSSHDGDQVRQVLNLIDGKNVYSAVSVEFLHGMSVVSGKVS